MKIPYEISLPPVYNSETFTYISVSMHTLKLLLDYNTKIFIKGTIIDKRRDIFFRVTKSQLIPEVISIYILLWTPYSFIHLFYLARLLSF